MLICSFINEIEIIELVSDEFGLKYTQKFT